MNNNKYFALGDDPIAAIAAVGFTKPLTGFARGAYQHESLPLDVRFSDHHEGWFVVKNGEEKVHWPASIDSLRVFVQLFKHKKLADDLEQEFGDLLRSKNVLMDGYMCRQVACFSKSVAVSAKFKKVTE